LGEHDEDGDGHIHKDELEDTYHTLFEMADHMTNQDGKLDLDEIAGAY